MSDIEARQRDHAIRVNAEMSAELDKCRDDLRRIVGAVIHVGGMKLLTEVATVALNIRNAEAAQSAGKGVE